MADEQASGACGLNAHGGSTPLIRIMNKRRAGFWDTGNFFITVFFSLVLAAGVAGAPQPAAEQAQDVDALIDSVLFITADAFSWRTPAAQLVTMDDAAVPALLRKFNEVQSQIADANSDDLDPWSKLLHERDMIVGILCDIGTPEALPLVDQMSDFGFYYPSAKEKERVVSLYRESLRNKVLIWNSPDRLEELISILGGSAARKVFSPEKWAIYKLGLLCDERALPVLRKTLESHAQLDIRESARDSIAHIESPETVPLVYKYHLASERFEIKPIIEAYELGEPVIVKCELKAGEYGSRDLLEFAGTSGNLLPFGLAGPEGRFARYKVDMWQYKPRAGGVDAFEVQKDVAEEKPAKEFQLGPHESVTCEVDISKAFPLNHAGEFRVSISAGKGTFSNSPLIRIVDRQTPQVP